MAALTRRLFHWRGAISLVLGLLLINLTFFPLSAASQNSLPYTSNWEVFRVENPEGAAGAEIQNSEKAPGLPQLLLVLWITPDEGYYAYGHEPGPTGQPTNLTVTPPPGMNARVFYPRGHFKPDIFDSSLTVEKYEGKTPVFVCLYGEPSEVLFLAGQLEMLLCSDTSCWPVHDDVIVEVPDLKIRDLPVANAQDWWPVFLAALNDTAEPAQQASEPPAMSGREGQLEQAPEILQLVPRYFQPELEVGGLGKAALLALLAGLILNFMPCVLPVVSLKLSTLVSASGIEDMEDKTRHFREHNIFFAIGILIYFIVLGVILGMIGMAWGQIFQKPLLIMAVTAVVFGLSLSLFGVFDLPVVDLKTGASGKNNKTQALFTGFLATLLATPCSGPFLGGVLGWTLTQAPTTIVSVFLCIGGGMASPYLLMAVWPNLVRIFPKPGGWTVFLERLVGFFLVGTCVYLLSILPAEYKLPAMILLLGTSFAAWIWGGWTNLSDSTTRRLIIRAIAILVLVLVAVWTLRHPVPRQDWVAFESQEFIETLGQKPLVLDFTADWCPNCKVLEKTTLSSDRVDDWKERYNAVFMQVDLTEDNPEGQALLEALGSQSIPVVALFPTGQDSTSPLVLRDIFTPSQMEKALEQVFEPR